VTNAGLVLETPRLRLRRFVADDAPLVAAIFADEAARRFYPEMHRLENAQRWVHRNIERYDVDGIGLWAVTDGETGEFAGDAGLMFQPLEGAIEVEVGYHFRAACRGRGFASEAAAACMAWGFEQRRFPRIVSLVDPDNDASHRVAARIHRHVRRAERQGILYFVYYTDGVQHDGPGTTGNETAADR
jgi:RimJ/RimL family protein N-acetyltransferase